MKKTIEEKAKAYDIAVELAAKFKKEYLNYKELNVHKGVIEAFNSIFPELKENDDEKIRNELIEHINSFKTTVISDLKERQYDSWIDWLERQGRQNHGDKVEPKFNIGDTIVEKDIDECGYGTIKDIKGGQYIFTDGSGMNINEQDGWQLVKTSTKH